MDLNTVGRLIPDSVVLKTRDKLLNIATWNAISLF